MLGLILGREFLSCPDSQFSARLDGEDLIIRLRAVLPTKLEMSLGPALEVAF